DRNGVRVFEAGLAFVELALVCRAAEELHRVAAAGQPHDRVVAARVADGAALEGESAREGAHLDPAHGRIGHSICDLARDLAAFLQRGVDAGGGGARGDGYRV